MRSWDHDMAFWGHEMAFFFSPSSLCPYLSIICAFMYCRSFCCLICQYDFLWLWAHIFWSMVSVFHAHLVWRFVLLGNKISIMISYVSYILQQQSKLLCTISPCKTSFSSHWVGWSEC
jgi:hypothetical protein